MLNEKELKQAQWRNPNGRQRIGIGSDLTSSAARLLGKANSPGHSAPSGFLHSACLKSGAVGNERRSGRNDTSSSVEHAIPFT